MKTKLPTLLAAILLITASGLASAGGPLHQSAQAVQYSGQAVGHSIAASGRLSAGVIALPLKAVGAIGQASGRAGDELWEAADWDRPLPLTEEHLTIGPAPDQALEPR